MMAYLAVCTFDLKSATFDDYRDAYDALERIGLKKAVVGSNKNTVVAPTTMTLGEFNGQDTGTVRDWVRNQVKTAFDRLGLKSEIFVVVGGDWSGALRRPDFGCSTLFSRLRGVRRKACTARSSFCL
jgi:hypothetical protein